MGFLVTLIILAVLAIPVLILLGVGGIAVADGKAQERAPETLDTAFDGRDTVVYDTKVIGPQVKDVITGADQRGYDLTGNVPGSYGTATLTFTKRPEGSTHAPEATRDADNVGGSR